MAIELLAPTTAATQSQGFRVGNSTTHQGGGPPPVVFYCPVSGAETASLEISPDSGTTWHQWLPEQTNRSGGFTSTLRHVEIDVPGVYRVKKTSTAAAVGAYVSTKEIP